MPPRRDDSSTSFESSTELSFHSIEYAMQESEGCQERLVFPQHLHSMIQSASKVTIVSDNAKVPPLSPWSPLFREERGLPPLSQMTRRDSESHNNSRHHTRDGAKRRKPESRWESMPQPKRFNDDFPIQPTFALLPQSAVHVGKGAPTPPVPETSVLSPTLSSRPSSGSDTSPGLNIPRRRESFETGTNNSLNTKEGASLLSQVLGTLDLSDSEEDDHVKQWIAEASKAVPPPPGRFRLPSNPSIAAPTHSTATRPALSVEQERRQSADSLNIPVRRQSLDSTELEGLDDIFSDEEESEHVEYLDDDDDGNYELLDESEDPEEDDDDAVDNELSLRSTGYLARDNFKDDCTLATVATTSTLSTLRSSVSDKESLR